MKNKTILFIILFCLLSISLQAVEIPSNVVDAKTLSNYYKQNIKYQRDKTFDYWQSPEETMRLKTADCEDFSFLTKNILEQLKYRCRIYAVFFYNINNEGHIICVYEDIDGCCKIFSNEFILYAKGLNDLEVIKKVYKNWRKIYRVKPLFYGETNGFHQHAELIEER